MPNTITFTVLKAVVLLTNATDQVSIQVDKPSPFPPAVNSEPLYLNFEVTKDKGIEYCKIQLGLDPEVINTRYKF